MIWLENVVSCKACGILLDKSNVPSEFVVFERGDYYYYCFNHNPKEVV